MAIRYAFLKSRMFKDIEREIECQRTKIVLESKRWNGRTDKKGNVKRREIKEKRWKRWRTRKAEKAIEGRKTNIKGKKQLSKVDGVVLFLRDRRSRTNEN